MQVIDIAGNLTYPLHGIAMEPDTVFAGNGTDSGQRSDSADFAVDVHDGDEHGVGRDGLTDIVWIYESKTVYRDIGHFKALFLQRLAAVQHRLVLSGRRNNMAALVTIGPGNAFERQVVRLRRTTGKDDLFGLGPDQGRNLLAGSMHRLFGFPAIPVRPTRRIAELLREIRHHGVEDSGIDGCRGVMIEVDGAIHPHALFHSLRFDTIFKHLQAKRTAGGHDRGTGLDGLLGAHVVHPSSDVDLHERMTAASATAQALTLIPAHLLHLDTGECLECLAWLGKDVVVASEVARIVVRYLGAQLLRRSKAAFLKQARNELAMVDHLEMAAKLRVLVL